MNADEMMELQRRLATLEGDLALNRKQAGRMEDFRFEIDELKVDSKINYPLVVMSALLVAMVLVTAVLLIGTSG